VVIDRADPAGLADWIRRERVEAVSVVPTVLADLLTSSDVDPADLASLVRVGVGGARCPRAVRDVYRDRLGLPLISGYGFTEAPTSVAVERADGPFHPGASGWPLPYVDISIRDGEICVAPAAKGPWAGVYTPFLGYWGRADATAEVLRDGVFHTGDVGHLGDDGALYVDDRMVDVIVRGGANVYPAEVERVILEDDRVADCAVVGRYDERLGERVTAHVELLAGSSVTADELEARCRAELAHYKVPDQWIFVDALPRNTAGKVLKAELRAG